MRFKVSALTCVVAVCALVVTAASQTSQSSSASQATIAGTHKAAAGQKTVVGCVAREGEGFVLKTDEGTYEFDTARDLTPYVGKKVRISGSWKATGVTTTAPIKGTASTQAGGQDEKKSSAPQSFTGDLHLHITGDVIGDCAGQP
jgi:hypothetical protein